VQAETLRAKAKSPAAYLRQVAESVDGRHTEPTLLLVDLISEAFLRGAATCQCSSGILFEEASRLFNYGLPDSSRVCKGFEPLIAGKH
jgi:hypothetical protein